MPGSKKVPSEEEDEMVYTAEQAIRLERERVAALPITAVLVGATPETREWVDVMPGTEVLALDRWRRRVRFTDAGGETWTVPGRDGTIAGFRRAPATARLP